MPASIQAAWGRADRPAKGPKPGLSLPRIVAAAVAVAHRDGLEAVSMSRVAAELGVSTMALYRYVGAKEELLALMVDAVAGTPQMPAPGTPWRAGLTAWAGAIFAAYRREPWAVRAPISTMPPTPNQVGWLEAGLRCLAATPLSQPERISSVLLLSVFIRGAAALALDLSEAAGHGSYGELVRALTDPEGFPAVRAALGTGAFDDDGGLDGEFAFGLGRLLDGLAALMGERSPA